MPVYNKRPYLKKTLGSIFEQTFSDWELIVVDDGSTDGSLEEIPDRHPHIKCIRQDRKGPSNARNTGAKSASGEFLDFIDADDIFFGNKLEVEHEFLYRRRSAEWMISAFEHEISGAIHARFVKDISGRKLDGRPMVIDDALRDLTVAGWQSNGISISRNLFSETGGFDDNLHYYEITEFLIRCALLQPKVMIYNQPLFRVIDVPGSANKAVQEKITGFLRFGERLLELSSEHPRYFKQLEQTARRSLYDHAAALILAGDSKKARKYLMRRHPFKHEWRWWKMWIGSWIPRRWLLFFLEKKGYRL